MDRLIASGAVLRHLAAMTLGPVVHLLTGCAAVAVVGGGVAEGAGVLGLTGRLLSLATLTGMGE